MVLGLAILTPVFAADLRNAQPPAEDAITALVLDTPLRAQDKITLARRLVDQLRHDRARVPDPDPAFEHTHVPATEKSTAARLQHQLNHQLERAATHAFLIGAALASPRCCP